MLIARIGSRSVFVVQTLQLDGFLTQRLPRSDRSAVTLTLLPDVYKGNQKVQKLKSIHISGWVDARGGNDSNARCGDYT